MNKNVTAIILIVLAIGIYFTFTKGKLEELKAIQVVNAEYQAAIDNSQNLIKVRDDVLRAYNNLTPEQKDRLNKIVPNNVDNVRLIIDVKDDIAAAHGLALKNIKTTSPSTSSGSGSSASTLSDSSAKYGVVTLSFSVTTSYDNFVSFLRDLEGSLRLMDISKLTLATNDQGTYDFNVELKTYWLK